jgi:hypothetical protein
MNEAKHMYRDLMNALPPILPRKVYRDIRRVANLVWAIVGVCLTQTVRLEAWGEVLESRAHHAASGVRRFARFLHHPAIDPTRSIGLLYNLSSLTDLLTHACMSHWMQLL